MLQVNALIINSSSFFSSVGVGCADDEALTRLFQTSFLFVLFGRFTSPGSFWIFSPSGPPWHSPSRFVIRLLYHQSIAFRNHMTLWSNSISACCDRRRCCSLVHYINIA